MEGGKAAPIDHRQKGKHLMLCMMLTGTYLDLSGDSNPARDSDLPGAVTGLLVLVMGSNSMPDLQDRQSVAGAVIQKHMLQCMLHVCRVSIP